MNDATIIYYTSNQEDENFEQKIRDNILKNSGGLPIISVSQKPINFGKNICVGEVGVNEDNLYRQILIGCEDVKAKFVISAEADCLYPPDYFNFIPPTDDIYRYDNVWILKSWQNGYFKKRWSEGAQIMLKEHYIYLINKALQGLPVWNPISNKPHQRSRKMKEVFGKWMYKKFKYFTGNPVISVKTGNGLRKEAGTNGIFSENLPYWGLSIDLKKELSL